MQIEYLDQLRQLLYQNNVELFFQLIESQGYDELEVFQQIWDKYNYDGLCVFVKHQVSIIKGNHPFYNVKYYNIYFGDFELNNTCKLLIEKIKQHET